MIHFVAFPLLVVLATATTAGRALDRLAPAAAARCMAVLLASIIVAAVPTFWILGLSGLAHIGVRSSLCDWSRHFLPDHPLLGGATGLAALALSVVGAFRLGSVIRTHLKVRCTATGSFHLVDTSEVFAYTLPGPARTIAISQGLRDSVSDSEYAVVLAHEQAHARHRHDRYLLLALAATAVVPFLGSATDRLRFHLERWADESALQATGADRRLAACTIAKVALAGQRSPSILGIASHGVAARADALIHPPADVGAAGRLQGAAVVLVMVALSAFQIHHTVVFAIHTMI